MPKTKTKKWTKARRAAYDAIAKRRIAVSAKPTERRPLAVKLGFADLANPNDRRRKAPRFDLIPRGPLARLADRYELGLRYGRDAWRAGLDLDDAYNHLIEHAASFNERLRLFRAGEGPDPRRGGDDDLAAVAWAAFALMEYQSHFGCEQFDSPARAK